MKNLNDIYLEVGTGPDGWGDKGTAHSYIEEYERLLSPYRDKNITLLEIGIQLGHSIQMWKKYFTNSSIYGVDIRDINHKHLLDNPDYNIITHDATKSSFLEEVTGVTFDIIIDDGSHRFEDQISSFNLLKPLMNPGGIYIIEDVANLDNKISTFQSLHKNHEILDRRKIKNRYDDVLIVYNF